MHQYLEMPVKGKCDGKGPRASTLQPPPAPAPALAPVPKHAPWMRQDQCYMAIRFLTDPALQAQLIWRIRPQLCAGCGSHLRPMLMHMESQHGLMAQPTENGLCLTKSRGKGLHDCNHSKSAVPVSSFIITRNRLYRVRASNVFDELRNRPQRDHLILLPNYDQCKLTNED